MSGRRGGWGPPVGAALAQVVLFVAVLGIVLAVAAELELSRAETTAWILGVYGFTGVLTLVFVLRYRQPLLVTGNVFILIFVGSIGTDLSWPELVGATMVAGVAVLLFGPLGLTERLSDWLPAPIVFGLLAGAVLPFVVDLFTALGDDALMVGGMLVAYVVGRFVLGPQGPAILPALVVSLLLERDGWKALRAE